MLGYFMGDKKSDDIMQRNKMRREEMAMLKDGKTKALLQVDGITKKSTSIINEVAETIASKNEKILIGYTKENREKSKEIVKESK